MDYQQKLSARDVVNWRLPKITPRRKITTVSSPAPAPEAQPVFTGKGELSEYDIARLQATLRKQNIDLEQEQYNREQKLAETQRKEGEAEYKKEKYNLEQLLELRQGASGHAESDIIDAQILEIGERVTELAPIVGPALQIPQRTKMQLRSISYDKQFGHVGNEPRMPADAESWLSFGARKLAWHERVARKNSYVTEQQSDAPRTVQVGAADMEGISTPVYVTKRENGTIDMGTAESLFSISQYAKEFNVTVEDIQRWGNRVPLGVPVAGKINGKQHSRQQWMDLSTREVLWETVPIQGVTKAASGIIPGAKPFDEETRDLPVPASVQSWLEGLGAINTGDPSAPVISDMYKELFKELDGKAGDILNAMPAGASRQHLQRLLAIRKAQTEEMPGLSSDALLMHPDPINFVKTARRWYEFLKASPEGVHEAVSEITQKVVDSNINSFLPRNWVIRFVPHGVIERLSLGSAISQVITGEKGLGEAYRGLTNFTTNQLGLGHFTAVHFNEILTVKDGANNTFKFFLDDNDVVKDAYGRIQPWKRADLEEKIGGIDYQKEVIDKIYGRK